MHVQIDDSYHPPPHFGTTKARYRHQRFVARLRYNRVDQPQHQKIPGKQQGVNHPPS